ncbi:hypothetical protein Lepto7375DRAFT_0481 [Leptolyngbya sp. PCC 7375]|nr:hypothetical protein Lepto7375DRAFT_0481 [Leptolyngbya sp. PCC 7375]
MTTPSRKFSLLLAIWDYLNQPLFDRDVRFEWNPFKFTVSYRSKLLERCWTKDYVIEKNRQTLELYWRHNFNYGSMPDTAGSE